MASRDRDVRTWSSTDRPAERISISRPLRGVEVFSVRRSNRHWREAHETLTLALIHRGQPGLVAEWRNRCRSLTSGEGHIMGMEPGDVHVTERVRAPGGADFDVVRFDPARVSMAARSMGYRGAFHLKAPALTDPMAFEAIDRFVKTVAEGGDELSIECAETEALTEIIGRLGEPPHAHGLALDPERDFRLRRVRAYLSDNLTHRPTLEALESVTGLCRFRLCAIFKRSYGASLGQAWNALRFREAVRRLAAGSSVKMVVAELGYGDESYFWRVFKSHYGIAPGAWCAMLDANDRTRKVRNRTALQQPAGNDRQETGQE
jgi:AraC-like DNA-binding protein